MKKLEQYRGRRVLVTGHTGFKGSWLSEILLLAGAEVHGLALEPPTRPALFNQLRLARSIASHTIGDVRDAKLVSETVRRVRPDFIFHLAAQPIVRVSYRVPLLTFETNVMGTANVLEAVRACGPCSVVCVTTDKVYENDNSGKAFAEGDPMGGSDPYSASKGACEIVIASYRRSFFSAARCPVRLSSARAGNVIGGGDWAADRIVPDAMRAFLDGTPLVVRNANSTRPWQHVLEPLSGYLALALSGKSEAFNFGPDARTEKTVGQLVNELKRHFPKAKVEDRTDPSAPPEAQILRLDSKKARTDLNWQPKWNFRRTVAETASWYAAVDAGENVKDVTDRQIAAYFK